MVDRNFDEIQLQSCSSSEDDDVVEVPKKDSFVCPEQQIKRPRKSKKGEVDLIRAGSGDESLNVVGVVGLQDTDPFAVLLNNSNGNTKLATAQHETVHSASLNNEIESIKDIFDAIVNDKSSYSRVMDARSPSPNRTAESRKGVSDQREISRWDSPPQGDANGQFYDRSESPGHSKRFESKSRSVPVRDGVVERSSLARRALCPSPNPCSDFLGSAPAIPPQIPILATPGDPASVITAESLCLESKQVSGISGIVSDWPVSVTFHYSDGSSATHTTVDLQEGANPIPAFQFRLHQHERVAAVTYTHACAGLNQSILGSGIEFVTSFGRSFALCGRPDPFFSWGSRLDKTEWRVPPTRGIVALCLGREWEFDENRNFVQVPAPVLAPLLPLPPPAASPGRDR